MWHVIINENHLDGDVRIEKTEKLEVPILKEWESVWASCLSNDTAMREKKAAKEFLGWKMPFLAV